MKYLINIHFDCIFFSFNEVIGDCVTSSLLFYGGLYNNMILTCKLILLLLLLYCYTSRNRLKQRYRYIFGKGYGNLHLRDKPLFCIFVV